MLIFNKIKKTTKAILPQSLKYRIKNILLKFSFYNSYYYDLKRYFSYSSTQSSDNEIKLIAEMIRYYHVVEKGLTMPQTRLGFGKELILSLCNMCEKYVTLYNCTNDQFLHTINILNEYKFFHEKNNYQLDNIIISSIENLNLKVQKVNFEIEFQISISKDEYFKNINCSFVDFSNSRHSVRNFNSEVELDVDRICQAIQLAKNTPSACNRQPWRTYVFSNKNQIKKILELQGGNRGFGHLTNKLVIITSEVGGFFGVHERNQAFIDGGMYAMNLLFGLHHYEIATCILNCSHSKAKDIQMRKICNINESEVFIAMIACGIPPNEFKIATSKRFEIEVTNRIIN